MLTSSTQLQNRSFQVVERLTTTAKWTKVKTARPKCAKLLFFLNLQILWHCCSRGCLGSKCLPWLFLLPPFYSIYEDCPQNTEFIIIWWSCWAICVHCTLQREKKNISLNRMPREIRRSCVRTFSKGPLAKCLGVGFTLGFDPQGLHSHTKSLPRWGWMEHVNSWSGFADTAKWLAGQLWGLEKHFKGLSCGTVVRDSFFFYSSMEISRKQFNSGKIGKSFSLGNIHLPREKWLLYNCNCNYWRHRFSQSGAII